MDKFNLSSMLYTPTLDRPRTAMKETVTPQLSAPVKPILLQTWVDLEDFAKCFQWDTLKRQICIAQNAAAIYRVTKQSWK